MSMPSIDLDCAKCGFHGSSSVVWGQFFYLLDGYQIPLNRHLGWCHDCESFKPIEYFDPDGCFRKIIEAREELKRFKTCSLMQVFSKSRRDLVKHYQEKIDKHILMLHLISKRTNTEKCLDCGSTHASPFDGDYSLTFESFQYHGVKQTGFIHPGCGGEFIATPNPMRFHRSFTPQYYNFDGLEA